MEKKLVFTLGINLESKVIVEKLKFLISSAKNSLKIKKLDNCQQLLSDIYYIKKMNNEISIQMFKSLM